MTLSIYSFIHQILLSPIQLGIIQTTVTHRPDITPPSPPTPPLPPTSPSIPQTAPPGVRSPSPLPSHPDIADTAVRNVPLCSDDSAHTGSSQPAAGPAGRKISPHGHLAQGDIKNIVVKQQTECWQYMSDTERHYACET